MSHTYVLVASWRLRLVTAVVVITAIVLILTASRKLVDPAAFRAALVAHGVIPIVAIGWATWLFPMLELSVAGYVLHQAIHHRVAAASRALAALMLVLALYAFWLALHPPAIPAPCGCGFSDSPVPSWAPLARRNGLWSAGFAGLAWLATARAPTSVVPAADPT